MFDLRAAALDHDLRNSQENVVYAAAPVALGPSRGRAFPRDEEGLFFSGKVLPCFGLWRGIEGERRARLAARLCVHRHRGPNDYAIELLAEGDEPRLVFARFPAGTLGEAARGVEQRLTGGVGLWGRIRGRDAFGPDDVLRVPRLDLRADHPNGPVAIDLDGSGAPEPPPEALRLGRGEMYRRYFQLNEPFILWLGAPNAVETLLVAWLGRP